MKFTGFILCMLLLYSNSGKAQETANAGSVEELFLEQLSLYPQEKIYVHTDRPTYVLGETIWFRAHLVDALLLKQANASRYVYLELINPAGHVAQRVKLRPDSLGCFYGCIQLEEDLPEGRYVLRAYTRFMQNQGEDYFFSKPVYVTSPLSEEFSPVVGYVADGNKMKMEIHVLNQPDGKEVVPEQCLIFPDGDITGESKSLSFKKEIASYTFSPKETGEKKVFLLRTVVDGKKYDRFFDIPCLEQTFDLSFFPEGGHAPLSANIQVAFKAINTDGLSEEIKGVVYDDQDQVFGSFETTHLGMGSFRMYYSPGRKYYAVCTNKENISKRFDLPEPSKDVVSLKTIWDRDNLRVTLTKSPDFVLPQQMQLIAHIRGAVIYEQPWNEKQGYIVFKKDFFPAGIVHFLLIDQERNIWSERLVFSSQRSTFARAVASFDKKEYGTRDKVTLKIAVTDENTSPLSGNFSLAVVDKKDVGIDTISTILSTLLLSSELKGHIECPVGYLQKEDKKNMLALDALMMTQGWRRYDIPGILKGKLTRVLEYPVESGEEVTGKVEGVFAALKEGGISLLALKDSVIGTAFVEPDEKGNFVFRDLEYSEGSQYIIQALTKKGSRRAYLEVDPPKLFPDVVLSGRVPVTAKPQLKETYLSKVYQQYTMKDGMKMYNLDEVVVTAKRKPVPKTKSPYYSGSASQVLTAEDIDTWKLLSVSDLLRRLPGVTLNGTQVRYRGEEPMFILDNVPTDNFDYDVLDISDISDVFALPATSVAALFGSRASGGAIVINTKRGFVPKNKLNSNIQIVKPMGYQQPVTFYSPAYATKEDKEKITPDLRSTIYWNPNVMVDETGIATLTFYSADSPSEYGVVIEGVSALGHLVYANDAGVHIGE